MPLINNPFHTGNYTSPEYFCNRKEESIKISATLLSGNNIALLALRRSGKSWLIENSLRIRDIYRDFLIIKLDIYYVRTLAEFTELLEKEVTRLLKPQIPRNQMPFMQEEQGYETEEMNESDNDAQALRLEEVFNNIDTSSRPFIVIIDEFQRVLEFPEKGASKLLQNYIQQTRSARFILAGSPVLKKSIFSNSGILSTSFTIIEPQPVSLNDYSFFVTYHFRNAGFDITSETIALVYETFEGKLWYMQHIMNALFNRAQKASVCTPQMVNIAIDETLENLNHLYEETLYRIPPKQKELLMAIAKEGVVKNITSGPFVKKHDLTSQSSVQAALKGLLERDYVTKTTTGTPPVVTYSLTDLFLRLKMIKGQL